MGLLSKYKANNGIQVNSGEPENKFMDFEEFSRYYANRKASPLLNQPIPKKEDYDIEGAYEVYLRDPKGFDGNFAQYNSQDNSVHFASVGTKQQFLKGASHPTAWMEMDYYNSIPLKNRTSRLTYDRANNRYQYVPFTYPQSLISRF